MKKLKIISAVFKLFVLVFIVFSCEKEEIIPSSTTTKCNITFNVAEIEHTSTSLKSANTTEELYMYISLRNDNTAYEQYWPVAPSTFQFTYDIPEYGVDVIICNTVLDELHNDASLTKHAYSWRGEIMPSTETQTIDVEMNIITMELKWDFDDDAFRIFEEEYRFVMWQLYDWSTPYEDRHYTVINNTNEYKIMAPFDLYSININYLEEDEPDITLDPCLYLGPGKRHTIRLNSDNTVNITYDDTLTDTTITL